MTEYKIKIHSRNKHSFYDFFKLLKKQNEMYNLQAPVNASKNKKTRQTVTILKSPHVNKKAQKQFELITYCYKISYLSWEMKKNLLQLKKIKNYLFPTMKIRIQNNIFSKQKLRKNKLFKPANTIYYNVKAFFFDQTTLKKQILMFKSNDKKNKKLIKKTLLNLELLNQYGKF